MPHQARAGVAICGAGVIGAAVAYYLARRGCDRHRTLWRRLRRLWQGRRVSGARLVR
jgi:glycine/D-amino acid oxidase-like deaminating enzyme